MTERIRDGREQPQDHDRRDDGSEVIDVTGHAGVVHTARGETPVGTTPIRQGSIPDDEEQRPATDSRLRDDAAGRP